MESRSPPWFTIDLDCPSLAFDNAMNDCQPETRSFSRILGGEIGIEDSLDGCPVHTVTGILNRELEILSRMELLRPITASRVESNTGKRHGQQAASFAHGMRGIRYQIHQYLVNLSGIRQNEIITPCGFDLPADFDGGGQRRSQQFHDLLDQGYEMQRLRLLLTHAAEGEDLPDQIPAR